MDYITIIAPTYEEAVAKAKNEYGSRLRIHSRKTITKAGLFGMNKSTMCELTCFLTEDEPSLKAEVDLASVEANPSFEEKTQKDEELLKFEAEARTPNPDISLNVLEEELKVIEENKPEGTKEEEKNKDEKLVDTEEINSRLDRARQILFVNDFTTSYIDAITNAIKEILIEAYPTLPSDEELEIMVLDKIAESLLVDTNFGQNPQRIVVVMGPSSSGKTTMVAKLTALFSSVNNTVRRNVRVVLLDDSPAVVGQLQKVGKALNVPVTVAPHEAELAEALNAQMNNELIFVDAIGKPIQNTNPDYKIFGLMNVANKTETKFLLVLPAPMKNTDLSRVFEQYKTCSMSGLIVTKLDETTTIGNVIAASFEHKLPIVYTSSGKKIPKDISKASSNAILRMLKGFKLDINKVLDSEQ